LLCMCFPTKKPGRFDSGFWFPFFDITDAAIAACAETVVLLGGVLQHSLAIDDKAGGGDRAGQHAGATKRLKLLHFEQKITKRTKTRRYFLHLFVTFVSFCKIQRANRSSYYRHKGVSRLA